MVLARSLLVLVAAAAALLITPAAWGGGGGGGESSLCPAFASHASEEVVLRDLCFEPIGVVAAAGRSMTVTNEGQQPHTYTAVDGSFDTGTLASGESADVVIPEDASGVVPVYCTLHADRAGNGMAGTLNVLAASDGGGTEPTARLGSAGFAVAAGIVAGAGGSTWWRRRRGRRATVAVRGPSGEA